MPDDPLFSYTSGRFVYNEKARMLERHIPFNVSALKNVVAKHVGHGNVKSIVKHSEGGFNRVLLATMEDGFRAIVKIPYWISVPKTYATASEVATPTKIIWCSLRSTSQLLLIFFRKTSYTF